MNKKIITILVTTFLGLIFSSPGHASLEISQQVRRIISIQPLLDRIQLIGNLSDLVLIKDDGKYKYYKVDSRGKFKVRILSTSDRSEMEVLNGNGEWETARIHFHKTGITVNYGKDGILTGYTRKVDESCTAHYHSLDSALTDKTAVNADFYTGSTKEAFYSYYFDSLDHASGEAGHISHLRVYSDGDRYQVEIRSFSGKWRVVMLISPESGIITNYKNRANAGKSILTKDGRIIDYIN